jgi:hypothetical protein
MGKEKLGSRGKEHVSEMMERFNKGKLLRTSAGKKLDPEKPEDREQALAIFYSEARRGEDRGFTKRTWKGSTRTRPKKAK